MTSARPYRDEMRSGVARFRLAQAVEAQFDTSVVAAFEAILAGASEDYRRGLCPALVLYSFACAGITPPSGGTMAPGAASPPAAGLILFASPRVPAACAARVRPRFCGFC